MGFLNSLIVRIKGDNADLKKSLDDSNKKMNNFGATVKKIGGYIAAAFGVRAIVNFTKEAVQLAAEAEGIKAAFERIGNPKLLDDLKKATKGTVSELELMRRSVMAAQFNIPMNQLADLLAFATKRAQETGQSVDYLVQSIVLGIGRKCLHPDTIVNTIKGDKKLIDVQKGDLVKCLTFDGEFTYGAVAENKNNGYQITYKITLDNGYELIGTANHKIYTSIGWRYLGDLTDQDLIKTDSGYFKIREKQYFDIIEVYDISIPNYENFFGNGICVHNSPLILDNLGISAVRLREELKGAGVELTTVADVAGAVGKIAAEEMQKAGGIIETTGVKIEQIKAKWQEVKLSFGENILASESLKTSLNEWVIFFDLMGDKALTFGEKMKIVFKKDYLEYQERSQAFADTFKDYNLENIITAIDTLSKRTDEESQRLMELALARKAELELQTQSVDVGTSEIRTLESINKEIDTLNQMLVQTDVTRTDVIKTIYDEIRALNAEKAAIEALNAERDKSPSIAPVSGGGVTGVSVGAPAQSTTTLMGITPAVQTELGALIDSLGPMGQEAVMAFIDGMDNQLEAALFMVDSWTGTLQSAFMDMANVVTDSVAKIFEGIGSGNLEGAFKDILGGMGSFIANIGKMLVAYGAAMLAFSILSKSPDPISATAAIGAGLAAIAIGSLIKGAASRGMKSIGGGGGYSSGSYSRKRNIETSSMKIQVEGVLKGSDILISNRRTVAIQGGQT